MYSKIFLSYQCRYIIRTFKISVPITCYPIPTVARNQPKRAAAETLHSNAQNKSDLCHFQHTAIKFTAPSYIV